MTNQINSFPAGKYWIGDLCYVNALSKTWNETGGYGEATAGPRGSFDNVNGFFHVKDPDVVVWSHSTAHGDGSYDSSEGFEFCVDAGLIGVCPIEVAEMDGHYGGYVYEARREFTPFYRDGTFYIDNIAIYTNDHHSYDNDEDDYYDR
jgi:hypothetical protein